MLLASVIDLQRALDDFDYREAVFHEATPFMRRAGFYAYERFLPRQYEDELVHSAILPDPTMPYDEYAHLAQLGPNGAALVARHPSTPEAALVTLVQHENSAVQLAAVKHAHATFAVWRLGAASSSPQVRETVARHPQLTPDLLRALPLCEELAFNPATPGDVLERLIDRSGAREALAKHAALPESALAPLVEAELRDRSEAGVYLARRALPEELALRLASHPDPAVRGALTRRTERALLVLLSRDRQTGVRWALATNPSLPSDLIEALARDEMASVRAQIARRKDLPPHIVELLRRDSQTSVRDVLKR